MERSNGSVLQSSVLRVFQCFKRPVKNLMTTFEQFDV